MAAHGMGARANGRDRVVVTDGLRLAAIGRARPSCPWPWHGSCRGLLFGVGAYDPARSWPRRRPPRWSPARGAVPAVAGRRVDPTVALRQTDASPGGARIRRDRHDQEARARGRGGLVPGASGHGRRRRWRPMQAAHNRRDGRAAVWYFYSEVGIPDESSRFSEEPLPSSKPAGGRRDGAHLRPHLSRRRPRWTFAVAIPSATRRDDGPRGDAIVSASIPTRRTFKKERAGRFGSSTALGVPSTSSVWIGRQRYSSVDWLTPVAANTDGISARRSDEVLTTAGSKWVPSRTSLPSASPGQAFLGRTAGHHGVERVDDAHDGDPMGSRRPEADGSRAIELLVVVQRVEARPLQPERAQDGPRELGACASPAIRRIERARFSGWIGHADLARVVQQGPSSMSARPLSPSPAPGPTPPPLARRGRAHPVEVLEVEHLVERQISLRAWDEPSPRAPGA